MTLGSSDPYAQPRRPPTRRGNPVRDFSIFAIGCGVGLAAVLLAQRLFPEAIDEDLRHYLEVRQFVLDQYVDEVDTDELLKDALVGMVEGLDSYSSYYNVEEYARVERETLGSFTGIGVVLRRPLSDGRVLFPVPGSPAESGGVRVGDQLVSIDGVRVADMDSQTVSQHLGGEEGTLVQLEVIGRDGEPRALEITRGAVDDPSVRHTRMLDPKRGIGYAALRSFTHNTPDEFDRAVEWLKERGLQGLIIDLRDNGGGVLKSAVKIAQRFIPSGPIVSTRGRTESMRIEADGSQLRWEGMPLVVLVDPGSASASEVLAGALQDHRAAVIIGTPTHGKGMVQTICRYQDRRAIAKVTSSRYYTPAERNLERDPDVGRDFGIVPDLEVPLGLRERAEAIVAIDRYSTPKEYIDQLRRWETEEDVVLVESPPLDDHQIRAAIQLLSGERPALAEAGN